MENFGSVFLATCVSVAILLLLIGVVYLIYSQVNLRKKRKYFAELHEELKCGQEIMFAGGIYGTITGINGDVVQVKVRSGATLDVSRYSIQQIDDSKSAADSKASKDAQDRGKKRG